MAATNDDRRVCPYSDPALCRVCYHDCNARELGALIEMLEAADTRLRKTLEEARKQLLRLGADTAGPAA